MAIVWEKYDNTRIGRWGAVEYDVYVSTSIVGRTNKERLNFYFANKGKEVAMNMLADRVEHSEILPTTTRIYFNFLPTGVEGGRKLGKTTSHNNLRASFPINSKVKKEVIKGRWVGDYKILYDKAERLWYIDCTSRIKQKER